MRRAPIVVALLALSTGSRAAPEPDVALFDVAVEDERHDRWEAARDKLTILAARRETAGVWFHLGHAAERLGRPCAAIGAFERASRLAGADPSLRSRADARAAQARRATSRLVVRVSPDHATASLDGGALTLDAPACVTPGAHTVDASAPGHQPASRVVTARAGQDEDVTLRLEPAPRPSALPLQPPPARDDTARWVLLGATGALAVASGALWFERARLSSEADSCGAGCDRAARVAASQRTGRAALATGALALVGGGAFVAWTFSL